MKKIIHDENLNRFIKYDMPDIKKEKVQDPFDFYNFKPLTYYNKKVWEVLDIPVTKDESDRTARARAFSIAKQKIFFNPDLKYFITLTYGENMQDYEQLKTDIKVFLNAERRQGKEVKYLWVVEKQKRGALHVHMICNDFFTVKKNKYNKLTIPTWDKGFTNVQEIKVKDSSETDVNFKPFLYMYKYMMKAEKIGGRYVHSSKNLKNYTTTSDLDIMNHVYTDKLHTEISKLGPIDSLVFRNYYKDIN